MNECENCKDRQACVPFFLHENTAIVKNEVMYDWYKNTDANRVRALPM